jgi:hypothetical protein
MVDDTFIRTARPDERPTLELVQRRASLTHSANHPATDWQPVTE